ncbi:GNAT family N-acetyltransferase [Comamonas sp. GB3 AK4-5]|uniref:GNAT family N-acetyltransferase n=1 Tax=Comamonas sp. GB3 AK4-5 TaxID=3231487 RepID=UPI00351F3CC5
MSNSVASTALRHSLQLRTLTPADVGGVLHIQTLCYGADFAESEAVFTRRLQAAHHCSWAAQQGGQLVAYLAAYWSGHGKVTPLEGDFAALPQASVLYLHDMAVNPAQAGQGVARKLLQVALDQASARGVRQAALVAVQGADRYWARQGFVPDPLQDGQQQAHLRSYGEDAVYMVRHW